MHLIAFVVALLVFPFLPGGVAQAQGQAQVKEWMEYAYPDRSFTVHFPAEPRIEPTSYQGTEGRAFEARVYSVTLEGRVFKLTVVELPESGTNGDAHVSHAVKILTDGNQIKLDIPHRIRQTYGRQLAVARADGGFSYLAVFVHKQRLYKLEGTALTAGGEAEVDAMIFHQSLDLT
jgi:hypothetical protein